MKFADLDQKTVEKLKVRRYDRIVEKHEGPANWKWQIESSECECTKANEHFISNKTKPNNSAMRPSRLFFN